MATLKAILGPTNTGKTHYAIERMLGHASGMIGLPLRLLAREVYDRVVAEKGAGACALITGEERIEPPQARYYVCTVEAMPVHRSVEFMAIDEIQLAEDPDRGHVFTDRILNARGRSETLLLGAETMRPVLADLDLGAETDRRERFSTLSHEGPVKLTRLPKRSAIVAFSAQAVYAIAELLRRHKGGAGVVMGALSPRTRNAQVELYQSGQVDYLVATDAIGMGLNLDVERVAFAERAKFDGRRHRALTAAECGQIAGRAGRFRNDGWFCETADCPPFEETLARQIESHAFDPIGEVQWRSSDLDFRSMRTLIASLSRPSGHAALRHTPDALDEWVLRRMAEDAKIGPDVRGRRQVRRLWDLARLPDFRKAGHEGHARLVLGLADTLADPDARLSNAGMTKRMESLSSTRGDIASLQQRLAAIRTWTYAAHRDDWLENPLEWRDKTREIEDRLSDALHNALMARFVDRRTTALLAGLKKEDALVTDIDSEGEIRVEGHVVGRLHGLSFEPASRERSLEGRAVRNAALQALRPILARRLDEIARAPDGAFALDEDGRITFSGAPIARLKPGADWLSPRVELVGGDDGTPAACETARLRAANWLETEIGRRLPTHHGLKRGGLAATLEGSARGLAFRILEHGAAIDLRADDPSLRLDREARAAMKAAGLRAGRVAAHAPDAQKPAAQRLISILRGVHDGPPCPRAPEGAGSFAIEAGWNDDTLLANGYLRFGARAVRADLAERLAWEVAKRRKEAGRNVFAIPIDLASVVSCPGDVFPDVLKGLGLVPAERDPETKAPVLWRYASRARPTDRTSGPARPRGKTNDRGKKPTPDGTSRRKPSRNATAGASAPDPDSPFAALAVLVEPKPGPKRKQKARRRRSKTAKSPGQPANAGFTYRPFE